MNFLSLPTEVRVRIYDFCFPPAQSHVQLIPYHKSSPACHLNFPLSLYLVSKSVHAELPALASKVRSLDLVYIIQGAFIGPYWHPEDGEREDDDPDLHHFQSVLRFAERVRLVGQGESRHSGRPISCALRRLSPGTECALRILEVQPKTWTMRLVVRTVMSGLGLLATHPDVANRLEVRLIRDRDGPAQNKALDDMEDWLRRYQELRNTDVSRRFSTSGQSFDL